MIKHKNKIIVAFIVISILILTFFWNGNSTTKRENELTNETISGTHNTEEEKIKDAQKTIGVQEESPDEWINKEEAIQPLPDEQTDEINQKEISKSIQNDEKIPPPEKSIAKDNVMTCSISVKCDTVLENMQHLDKSKQNIIPKDGIIFENQNAVIYEGESVFNVLVRELKKNKIHFEYTKAPMYNSVYIEGIGNLYEFDCGELSGWLYKVNGSSPGCGCSQYILKDKDVVEFIYSCNMGKDVGGYKALSGE